MSHEQIQAAIDALPYEHRPMPFKVFIRDQRGNSLRTVYVRASSLERAELTGLRVAKYEFGDRRAADGVAVREGWNDEYLAKLDQERPYNKAR